MSNRVDKLTEGIAFFEQLLGSDEKNRLAMEFLTIAYLKVGKQAAAHAMMVRLVSLFLSMGKIEAAEALLESLSKETSDPAIETLMKRVEVVKKMQQIRATFKLNIDPVAHTSIVPEKGLAMATVGAVPSIESNPASELMQWTQAAIASELKLLHYLCQRTLLPAENREDLTRQITQRPITDVPLSVSLLSLIESLNAPLVESLIEDLANCFSMVPIPVDLFDISVELQQLLPRDYVIVRNVIPFAQLGTEILIAIENPVDEALQLEVAQRIGTSCSFFLAKPQAMRETLKHYFEPTRE